MFKSDIALQCSMLLTLSASQNCDRLRGNYQGLVLELPAEDVLKTTLWFARTQLETNDCNRAQWSVYGEPL